MAKRKTQPLKLIYAGTDPLSAILHSNLARTDNEWKSETLRPLPVVILLYFPPCQPKINKLSVCATFHPTVAFSPSCANY